MRGKVLRHVFQRHRPGITPAYAGKRSLRLPYSVRQQDHPRLCGEKLQALIAALPSIRITPAYAGKSHSLNPINIRS